MVVIMTAFYPASRLPKEIQLDFERYQNLSIQAVFEHFRKSWHEKRDSSDNCPFGAPSEIKSELSAELSISSIVMVLLPSL